MNRKIYLDYTQEELDQQYEHRSIVPEGDKFLAQTEAESHRVGEMAKGLFDVAYGPEAEQLLDIYTVEKNCPSPVVIFFHGGRWSRGSKSSNIESLTIYNANGILFVSVGFTLIPNITMDSLIAQCRAAIVWLWQNAQTYGGDRQNFYVFGKSSGAHLAGMMVVTDWSKDFDLPKNVIKGGLLVSGMYDLEPVRLSFRNSFLKLNESEAFRNSPILQIPEGGCPLIIGFGSKETDEFQRQSIAFADAWKKKGLKCSLVKVEGHHHFSINSEMCNANGILISSFLKLIRKIFQ